MKEFGFSDDLINAYNIALNQYKNNTNVFLVDIGCKYKDKKRLEELCIRIHSEQKIEEPIKNELFQFIDYKNYGRQNTNRILPVNSQRIKFRKVIQPGISIGYSNSGTLGLICFDKLNSSKPCILTAGHVIKGSVGAIVTQPGRGIDRGHPKYHGFANILRFDNNGDAAIASLNGRRSYKLEQFETGNTIKALRAVRVGDILTKSGRTTGLTDALVDGIGTFLQRSHSQRKEISGFRLVPLDGQDREIVEISNSGDSGAVWFDNNTNEGIGLHIAGENSSYKAYLEFAFAQHLPDIFEKLQISII